MNKKVLFRLVVLVLLVIVPIVISYFFNYNFILNKMDTNYDS